VEFSEKQIGDKNILNGRAFTKLVCLDLSTNDLTNKSRQHSLYSQKKNGAPRFLNENNQIGEFLNEDGSAYVALSNWGVNERSESFRPFQTSSK